VGALVPLLHSAQPDCPFEQPPQRGGFKEFVADTKSEPASQGIEIRTIDHRGIGFIQIESVKSAVKKSETWVWMRLPR
jgi:hypothetical protein